MLLNEKQKHLLESDAKANNIARISVWIYNDAMDLIKSEIIYSLDKDQFIPGLSLSKKDFPNYFKALENNNVIDAHNACTDFRTIELTESYLNPLGITSLLDIPIKIGHHKIGVVCHEHIGLPRVWSEREINYAQSIASLFALAIETVEKDKVMNTLLESESRLKFALTTLPVIFWTTDLNLMITSSNGDGIKSAKSRLISNVGKSMFEFLRTSDNDHYVIQHHKNVLKGNSAKFEYVFLRFVFEVYVEPLKNINGEIIGCTGLALNITERKNIELRLSSSEERFRRMAETANIIPWEIEVKTLNCTYVGPQAEKILGYPVIDWFKPTFWTDHLHPDDKEFAKNYFNEGNSSKKSYEYEYRMIAKDGSVIWFQDVVTVEYKNKTPVYLRGFLIDITARKIAEKNTQQLNIELERRVEERTAELKSINKELEKAKVIAEESKITKDLFLASMSHEIRTPLNAIIGFQQLLKESTLTDEQRDFVESIDFAGKNLLVIINDILDLSKIESGKFTFEEVEINIQNIIHSVLELVEHRAKEKGLKLFFSYDSTIPHLLFGDSTRISQILLNLIGNAIKFTEKGEVRIITKLIEETEHFVQCEFRIEDTGIGISADKLPIIFESFSQENEATTRQYGGTGLGLTISRHLVELQGGKISVESEKGSGSVFKVILQLKKTSNRQQTDYNQLHKNQLQVPVRKLKVLLAEDVVLNQRLVVKIMEKWQYDLDIADNGKIAIELLLKNNYDIILMDIQMPIMDGYQTTTMIRSMPDTKKQSIPIIALTAHASQAEAEKCINLGMNAYMAKPFNQQNLLSTINQLTNNN